jgi:hypothetical protein
MPEIKRIALVGHCGPDSYVLRSAVGRFVPGAEIVFAADESSLKDELGKADLLLINRTLGGDFDVESGIELIRRLAGGAGDPVPRMMLVSNYAEAQSEAEDAGALKGFGKREMNAEETRAKVRAALGLE